MKMRAIVVMTAVVMIAHALVMMHPDEIHGVVMRCAGEMITK